MSKMPLAKWPSLDEAEKRVQNIVFRSPGSEAKDIATGRVSGTLIPAEQAGKGHEDRRGTRSRSLKGELCRASDQLAKTRHEA